MTDRQLVRRMLRLYLERLQARFRRRARMRGQREFLKRNPPCDSCAFNPRTLGWRGEQHTANSPRLALSERRPFFCHKGFPWKLPVGQWSPATIRRFFVERRFCMGWLTVVGALGVERDFERAALDAVRERERDRTETTA